jgi:hypothetical protein
MSQVPLIKWKKGQRFLAAQHALQEPVRIAAMQGAVLHFKMFDDLPAKCAIEIERGEHYKQSREYRVLGAIIEKTGGKSFFDPAISVRYQGTDQLVAMKLMGVGFERPRIWVM